MKKSKPKVFDGPCPRCRLPIISKVGDHCLCGATLLSNVVFIDRKSRDNPRSQRGAAIA